ncbi:hypothetical protein Ate01nite_72510 [Actinoplanes teichomyceticus]|nr:hypothetical protein Ate01nite_72510 [Actinoplanes teichomyceticus]
MAVPGRRATVPDRTGRVACITGRSTSRPAIRPRGDPDGPAPAGRNRTRGGAPSVTSVICVARRHRAVRPRRDNALVGGDPPGPRGPRVGPKVPDPRCHCT